MLSYRSACNDHITCSQLYCIILIKVVFYWSLVLWAFYFTWLFSSAIMLIKRFIYYISICCAICESNMSSMPILDPTSEAMETDVPAEEVSVYCVLVFIYKQMPYSF